MTGNPYYSGWKGVHRFDELRERIMNLVNNYGTSNNVEVAARQKEFLGDDHGMMEYWNRNKNYNINKIKFFKDIPDGVEILIDYIDVTAIRMMNIPTEIIYESIYRELPELFEE